MLCFPILIYSQVDSFLINGSIQGVSNGYIQIWQPKEDSSFYVSENIVTISNSIFTIKGHLEFPRSTLLVITDNENNVFETDWFFIDPGSQELSIPITDNDISVSSNDTNGYLTTGSITSNPTLTRENCSYIPHHFLLQRTGFQNIKDIVLAKIKDCQNNSSALAMDEKAKSRASNSVKENNIKEVKENESWIKQNTPNPFGETTTINYSIAKNHKNVELRVYNYVGQQVHQVRLRRLGKGTTQLNMNGFSKGLYQLVLVIDGKIVDSRKMVLTK